MEWKILCCLESQFFPMKKQMKKKICTKCIFARALAAIQKLTERTYAKHERANFQQSLCWCSQFLNFIFISFLNRSSERERDEAVKGRKAEKRRDCAKLLIRDAIDGAVGWEIFSRSLQTATKVESKKERKEFPFAMFEILLKLKIT